MAGRRDQIRMGPEELSGFMAEQPILIVATLGKDGWPQVTPLWYVMRDSEPWIFTYAKSQKVRNLERDPRATLLVEAGRKYDEVRGAMFTAEARIHTDFETVADVGEELFIRYSGSPGEDGAVMDEGMREEVRARARKRVAIQFHTLRTASWDHSKLGGAY